MKQNTFYLDSQLILCTNENFCLNLQAYIFLINVIENRIKSVQIT